LDAIQPGGHFNRRLAWKQAKIDWPDGRMALVLDHASKFTTG
jgi:hypothetical protein